MSKFEESYFKIAYGGDYEKRNPLRKLLYYVKLIQEVKRGGSMLDIGCAYGLFLSVASRYYTVTGSDISTYALKQAKSRLPQLEVIHSCVESLKTDASYDVITCFDILEHVNDLDSAIEKIKSLLKPKGVFVMTVPVYDTLAGKAVGILDKDETHIWKKGRIFWKKKLLDHDLKLLRDIGLWRYCLPGNYYIFFGGKIWRNFSPAIFLMAERK